jgi:thiosulfate dehydrogenase
MQAAIRKFAKTILGIFLAYISILVVVIIWLYRFQNQAVPTYIPLQEFTTVIEEAVYKTENEQIKLGYQLLVNTSLTIGPHVDDTTMRYSGNSLECISCHLNEGTKAFGIPLNTVVGRFPQYRGREDKIGTIEDRINGCLSRSMNGRPMETTQREMQAFVAYLSWLERYKPEGVSVASPLEVGLKEIELPNRQADLTVGALVYEQQCVVCHQKDGQGTFDNINGLYFYPPLWGAQAYNSGAGMSRLITAAQFIKYNMPFGVSHENPILTDEEAYDVAAYVNQKNRPIKSDLAADFPNRLKKPLSSPYPPFLDSFPLKQHQLGPFQPMIEHYLKEYRVIKTK